MHTHRLIKRQQTQRKRKRKREKESGDEGKERKGKKRNVTDENPTREIYHHKVGVTQRRNRAVSR